MSENNEDDLVNDDFWEEVQEDLKINELDLREELRMAANRTQKYIELFYKYNRMLRKLEAYVKKVEGELFHHYKFEFELNLSSSADVQKFINKDKRYVTATSKRDEYQALVDLLEKVVRNFQNRAFTLNKMVDMEKMQ